MRNHYQVYDNKNNYHQSYEYSPIGLNYASMTARMVKGIVFKTEEESGKTEEVFNFCPKKRNK